MYNINYQSSSVRNKRSLKHTNFRKTIFNFASPKNISCTSSLISRTFCSISHVSNLPTHVCNRHAPKLLLIISILLPLTEHYRTLSYMYLFKSSLTSTSYVYISALKKKKKKNLKFIESFSKWSFISIMSMIIF